MPAAAPSSSVRARSQFIQIHLTMIPLLADAATASKRAPLPFIMSSSIKTFWTETLPDPLPANPLAGRGAMVGAGRDRCRAAQSQRHGAGHRRWPRPTLGARGAVQGNRADARLPSCSTPTTSRARARELKANPRAAVVFHWDHRHRQVRAEGSVERCRTPRTTPIFRPAPGRAASAPGPASRASRWHRAMRSATRGRRGPALRHSLRRPGNAGTRRGERRSAAAAALGRLSPERRGVELWVEGEFRIHDRARWTRIDAARRAPGRRSGPSRDCSLTP